MSEYLDREEVIGIIASDMLGYRESILDSLDVLNGDVVDEDDYDHERFIVEDRAKTKALKRISRKLGIWELVEREIKDEE